MRPTWRRGHRPERPSASRKTGAPAREGSALRGVGRRFRLGRVLEHRSLRRAVLEADRVADVVAELAPHLLRDARRHRHGRDAARLRAPHDLAATGVARLVQVLRDLRRLAAPRLADDDQHLVRVDGLEDLLAVREDRQALAHLRERLLLRRRLLLGRGVEREVARLDLVRDELDLLLRRHHQLVLALGADLAPVPPVGRAHPGRRALDLRRVPRLVLVELLALRLVILGHQRLEPLLLVRVALGIVRLGHHVPLHLVGDAHALVGELVQLLLERVLLALAPRQLHVAVQELLVGEVVARRVEHLLLALCQVLLARRAPQLVEQLRLLVGAGRLQQLLLVAEPRLRRLRRRVAQRARAVQVPLPQPLRQLVALAQVPLAHRVGVERLVGRRRRLRGPLRLVLLLGARALALGPPPLLLPPLLLLLQRLLHRRRHLVRLDLRPVLDHLVLLVLPQQRHRLLSLLSFGAARGARADRLARHARPQLGSEALGGRRVRHVRRVQRRHQPGRGALLVGDAAHVVGRGGVREAEQRVQLVRDPRLEPCHSEARREPRAAH